MKRANISDVAQRADVSTATVSRVLNAPDRVGETTRERVLQAIDELQFVKSATAFNFKIQQTHTVLVLVAHVGSIYYSEVFGGLYKEAEARGYSITLATPEKGNVSRQITNHLRSGLVDGIIVLDSHDLSESDFDSLKTLYGGIPPVVGFSEKPGWLRYPHVFIDNRRAAMEATRHLIEAGHKDIGHITGSQLNPAMEERLGGFRAAMREARLEINPDNIFEANFHRDNGRRVARYLARRASMPTAMFCANDEIAMGLISELHIMGIKVPDDMSVVGFDNISVADVYVPALTTISQPREQIGQSTMALLIDILTNSSKNSDQVIELDVRLAKRASVAAPKS